VAVSSFGKSKAIKEINEHITFKEIKQQPRLWRETFGIIGDRKEEIADFLSKILLKERARIIFAGAGSSAYVGECVMSYLDKKLRPKVEAIAITDIVSNPNLYIHKDIPTLLISCARSGNSPESLAAVQLAGNIIDDLYQIILTCNPSGNLACRAKIDDKKLLLLMPSDADDQGFAMTGSFTTMVLASLLIFDLESIKELEKEVNLIVRQGEFILNQEIEILAEIELDDVSRVVYLGSNSLKGLAKESALKMLELTKGSVMANSETSLGFRHGPKAFLNSETIVFSYISNNEHAKKYEIDLLKEVKKEGRYKKIVTISLYEDETVKEVSDYHMHFEREKSTKRDDMYLTFNFIMYAQIFALLKSVQLGISPDNPYKDGSVNRVVKGVKIYPYKT